MARPKGSKNKEEVNIEEVIEESQQIPTEVSINQNTTATTVNNELQELLAIHKSMTDKGIKDIGQLEVLISRLQ